LPLTMKARVDPRPVHVEFVVNKLALGYLYVKWYPVTGQKTLNGCRRIALHFLDLGARRSGWSAPRSGRFTPWKDPVPIVQEAGWAPGPVWTAAKNLALTGIRSPDRSARSQSLYRLSYRAPTFLCTIVYFDFMPVESSYQCSILNCSPFTTYTIPLNP
jgi:hypothetical protein